MQASGAQNGVGWTGQWRERGGAWWEARPFALGDEGSPGGYTGFLFTR